MCGAVRGAAAVASFGAKYDCIPRALDTFECGLERGDDARNQLLLDLQPAIRDFVERLVHVHCIPIIVQDTDDIITTINLEFMRKTFEEIRKLRSRHSTKLSRGKASARGAGARRSARVVRTIIQRLCSRNVRVYVNHRLNDIPTVNAEDLVSFMEAYSTDHGAAAREVEREIDRAQVKAATSGKVMLHLACRRRRAEVADVVEQIASADTWERYIRCDALA